MSDRRLSNVTRTVRAALERDTQYGAVVPAIHLSSTYTFEGLGKRRQYDYSRSGNPTRDALGEALADLEGGAGGVITATGMAAVLLATSLLKADDLILAPNDCYGGTHRLLRSQAARGSYRVQFVNFHNEIEFAVALAEKPKIVWIETPSNPLLRITDIRKVSAAAHAVEALVVVDNTFLSPALQLPIQLGADIVVHSTTKYINGHSDVVGGAVIAKDKAIADKLAWWANCLGITGSPFDSFLTLRGLRTLHARWTLHEANSQAIAEFLDARPEVAKVHYPGLKNHPGHALAAQQQKGFGAIISFELEGGREQLSQFLDGLECFSLAESLGGVESLIAHPATMTHAAMDETARHTAGISDQLLRISVGIESTEDLIADLQHGFAQLAKNKVAIRAVS